MSLFTILLFLRFRKKHFLTSCLNVLVLLVGCHPFGMRQRNLFCCYGVARVSKKLLAAKAKFSNSFLFIITHFFLVSTSSLPLKLTCDSRTSHHIQAGGITLNGVPISSTLQNTAENECTNQVANQVGGTNGLELSCEIWFGNAFVLNSTDVLYAIYQCLEAKPYGEVVWQQATQPRYITLSGESYQLFLIITNLKFNG